MKQTIEERAYKAVPDMLRINDNYVASFVSGYCRGAIEERAEIKEYLEQKRQEIVSILEDITEEDTRYFAYYQRYVCLRIIINELFKE